MRAFIILTILSVANISSAEIFCQSQVAQGASSKFTAFATSHAQAGKMTLSGVYIQSVSGIQSFTAAPNQISETFGIDGYSVEGEFDLKSIRGSSSVQGLVTATVYTKAGTCEVVSVDAKVTRLTTDD